MDDDLAVDGPLEQGALLHQLLPEDQGVGDVPVVDQPQVTLPVVHHDGLGVHKPGAPGGGVPRVPERHPSGECFQGRVVEPLGYEPVALGEA